MIAWTSPATTGLFESQGNCQDMRAAPITIMETVPQSLSMSTEIADLPTSLPLATKSPILTTSPPAPPGRNKFPNSPAKKIEADSANRISIPAIRKKILHRRRQRNWTRPASTNPASSHRMSAETMIEKICLRKSCCINSHASRVVLTTACMTRMRIRGFFGFVTEPGR